MTDEQINFMNGFIISLLVDGYTVTEDSEDSFIVSQNNAVDFKLLDFQNGVITGLEYRPYLFGKLKV